MLKKSIKEPEENDKFLFKFEVEKTFLTISKSLKNMKDKIDNFDLYKRPHKTSSTWQQSQRVNEKPGKIISNSYHERAYLSNIY